MSVAEAQEQRQEIIIVRRGGGGEDDHHHGGVWKIAFADFMTAMMCFFLVMWLINATNEQTKIAVASYFNPVKLMDSHANRKGVDEPGRGEQFANNPDEVNDMTTDRPIGARRALTGPADHDSATNLSDTWRASDRNLFADPYAVLAEIARQTATLQNISSRGDGGAQISGPASGAEGGESYRDPFAPDFWSRQVAVPDLSMPDPAVERAVAEAPAETGREPAPEAPPAPAEAAPAEAADAAELAAEPDSGRFDDRPTEASERVAGELRDEFATLFGQGDALNRTVTVTPRRSGVLISLTDELNYGMFEIGSAVPQRQLVLAMEKIGAALDRHGGSVAVMGHTDARPFRSADYDNWRLSTARAHAAYYMLVRGGLAESRVTEIAGYADRLPRVPEDPLADANRRIEIFLEVGE